MAIIPVDNPDGVTKFGVVTEDLTKGIAVCLHSEDDGEFVRRVYLSRNRFLSFAKCNKVPEMLKFEVIDTSADAYKTMVKDIKHNLRFMGFTEDYDVIVGSIVCNLTRQVDKLTKSTKVGGINA